ncbi:MAG: hypothetical protein QOE65_2909 [Solirubrobacteraceae bacterium]|jgi:hypothetical protein|nr:hypothetical protein [Solirubrobacteraceae bacterium]
MSLTVDRARRLGGLAGIMFVVIAIVAFVLPGTPPKADEVAKISTFFADKHDQILASNYALGLAFMFFLIFAGALRTHLGAASGDGLRPGAVLLGSAAAAVALVVAGAAVLNGAVFHVAGTTPDANLERALYYVSSDLFLASGFAFAAFFVGAAMAISSTAVLPRALSPAALVLAVLNLVGPIGLFAETGFFAIGGAFGFVVPVASMLWVLAASVAMVRGRAAPAAAS